MCITLGYPTARASASCSPARPARGDRPAARGDDAGRADRGAARGAVGHASDALLDYLQALIQATRSGAWFVEGLSPRAGIAVLRAARARALLGGRDYVAPDDIQYVLPQTIAHRLVPIAGAGRGRREQVRR
jgi:MoxR-like ATPase